MKRRCLNAIAFGQQASRVDCAACGAPFLPAAVRASNACAVSLSATTRKTLPKRSSSLAAPIAGRAAATPARGPPVSLGRCARERLPPLLCGDTAAAGEDLQCAGHAIRSPSRAPAPELRPGRSPNWVAPAAGFSQGRESQPGMNATVERECYGSCLMPSWPASTVFRRTVSPACRSSMVCARFSSFLASPFRLIRRSAAA